jgi:hypothetical protein
MRARILALTGAFLLIGTSVSSAAGAPGHLFVHAVDETPATVVGDRDYFWITIANDGDADTKVTDVSFGGDAADEVTIHTPQNSVVVGAIIRKGHPESIDLDFRPDGVGPRTLTYSVTYDVDTEDGTDATDTVSGEVVLYGTADPRGIVAVNLPDDLGEVIQGQWLEFDITLRNIAEVPLSLDVRDSSASEVVDDADCVAERLSPGDTCTFRGRAKSDRIGSASVHFSVETLPVWQPPYIRADYRVVEDMSKPDKIWPTLDSLPDPRITKVRFSAPATMTVRQSFSASDNRPGFGFKVTVTDLATGRVRTLVDDAPPFGSPVHSVSVETPLTHPVRFSVEAVDAAGNRSPTRKSLDTAAKPRDLVRSMAKRAKDWETVTSSTARGGSFLQTTRPSARLTTNITAFEIVVVARRGPRSGKLDVYVDGVRRARVDLRSDSTGQQLSPVIHLDPKTRDYPHRIDLVAVRDGSRTTVGVDAILRIR